MVGQALSDVFGKPKYVLLAAATALAAFTLTTWLSNLGLVWQVVTLESVPITEKARILTALTGSIGTNFTIFSALSATSMAVLFGVNVAMITYVIRLRWQLSKQVGQGAAATSLGGFAAGLFGIGCAACGTLVLSPVLSLVGASTLITLLPLGGEEFSVVGIAMLVLSLVLTARKVSQAVACWDPVPTSHQRRSRNLA